MPLTTQPFAQVKELDALREKLSMNVAQPERIGSIIAGVALAAFGLSRRSAGGGLLALAGGMLVHRGVTGRCQLYKSLGVDTAHPHHEVGVPGDKGINVEKTVRVARSPEELFGFWRTLGNLPQFMPHVESVTELGGKRSHWVVKGPLGHRVEWDAEIINEHEGRMISWRSLPRAEVENAGSVWFEPAEDGSGTDVKVSLQYQPPAGVIGAAFAKIFGEAPDQQLETDLDRFKKLMETNPPAV